MTGDSVREDDRLRPDIQFMPRYGRLFLRNIPSIIVVGVVLFVVEAEVNSNVVGVSSLLSEMPLLPSVFLAAVWVGLTVVFIRSGIMEQDTFIKAVTIYGLAGLLLAGSVYGAYRTLRTRGGSPTTPHVTYLSSTLLVTLLVGVLSYDLLLKGENMFSNLGRTNIFDEQTYELFKEDLKADLRDGIGPLRYAHLFAVLLLSQFVFIWSMNGPLGIGLISGLVFTILIDFVLLVGVFQFLIGITSLRTMIRGQFEVDGERLQPSYLPFHPDGHAGYRDLGKCAMQINVIIILVGMYYAARAYIAGIRTFPAAPKPAFYPFFADTIGIYLSVSTSQLELVFWAINYLGPVIIYIAVVSFWFYYTFWEIHKRMLKGKKDKILERQSALRTDRDSIPAPSERTEGNGPEVPVAVDPVGEFPDKSPWVDLHDAPEWPINTRKLAWLVSGNAVPVLFSLPTLLPELATAWG